MTQREEGPLFNDCSNSNQPLFFFLFLFLKKIKTFFLFFFYPPVFFVFLWFLSFYFLKKLLLLLPCEFGRKSVWNLPLLLSLFSLFFFLKKFNLDSTSVLRAADHIINIMIYTLTVQFTVPSGRRHGVAGIGTLYWCTTTCCFFFFPLPFFIFLKRHKNE